MSPAQLTIDYNGFRMLIADFFKKGNCAFIIAIEPRSYRKSEPAVRSIMNSNEFFIDSDCILVFLLDGVKVAEALDYFTPLVALNRISTVISSKELFIDTNRFSVISNAKAYSGEHSQILWMPIAAVHSSFCSSKRSMNVIFSQQPFCQLQIIKWAR